MAVRGLGNGQKPALLINECQRGVLDPKLSFLPGLPEEAARRKLVANIMRLLGHFRARKLPVFHLPFVFRPDLADVVVNSMLMAMSAKNPRIVAGNIEAEFMPGLEPAEGEFVISRSANFIAFNETALDLTLRRLGTGTIVLCGVSTNIAIPGNTMRAVDLGYRVVIPEDCIAGGDAQTHRTIVDNQLRLLATITDCESVIAATV